MDAQHQVIDGFLGDVRQMHSIHKSFSSAELSSPRTPLRAALTAGHSVKALCAGSSGAELTLRRSRPSSASNPSGAVRAISLRSDAGSERRMGESRSQPALTAAAVGNLHQAAALKLPQRRAPPGAAGSDLRKDSAGAAAARRRVTATSSSGKAAFSCGVASGLARKLSHVGSSPQLVA
jgi:hypothetical protein